MQFTQLQARCWHILIILSALLLIVNYGQTVTQSNNNVPAEVAATTETDDQWKTFTTWQPEETKELLETLSDELLVYPDVMAEDEQVAQFAGRSDLTTLLAILFPNLNITTTTTTSTTTTAAPKAVYYYVPAPAAYYAYPPTGYSNYGGYGYGGYGYSGYGYNGYGYDPYYGYYYG